ncbi:MAG: hypothetical protein ACUVTL_09080 [Thermoproteota archaeon]
MGSSSSDGFWNFMPLSIKKLVYYSVAWSFCSVIILMTINLASEWIAMHEPLFLFLFVMTLMALCGGALFLARLLMLSLNLFGKRAPKAKK